MKTPEQLKGSIRSMAAKSGACAPDFLLTFPSRGIALGAAFCE